MSLGTSATVVSWNSVSELGACLESLRAQSLALDEVVVVDNASMDGSRPLVLQWYPTFKLVRNSRNEGYAVAANRGIRSTSGRYVLLVNPDAVLPRDAVGRLVTFMDTHPHAGACAPRLVAPDGRAQRFAWGDEPTPAYVLRRALTRVFLRRDLHDWESRSKSAVAWVSAACVLLRRRALDDAGLFDERFFLYFEDVDLCLRFGTYGWKVYRYPDVEVTHAGGSTAQRADLAARAYDDAFAQLFGKRYGMPAERAAQLLLRASRSAPGVSAGLRVTG